MNRRSLLIYAFKFQLRSLHLQFMLSKTKKISSAS
nr:MAG TPA: hypothetical protein [Herelleviridae sp.]DAN33260.1 MAG TPA: hypothetical protein [Caudoviricetes sp.]DAS70793.1 MAG TPA: hypothetical protein [Caudoviricetes sp.]